MQRPYGKVAMKKSALLIILLPLCACAERFVIDGHARTTVDVSLQGEMLIVVCRYPARSRLDDAINVRLNDQKGRRLFLEGLIRYFRAGSDGIMEVSGQRILETRKDGDRMSYKFAVPKDGCKGSHTTDRYGKTTYRDSQGRVTGSVTTDRYGKTTYRDAQGRVQRTVTTDRYGKTTYRDGQGRIQGTKTTDRYGKTTYRDANGRIQGTRK